ncbi:hypothetical protein [uncultured Megasphaera sp.]|uniref:hypothetical protein n=1 Tax=uncultured Megasphaera sp. TaxID=165188 RepID=UPI0025D49E21|nr:hypothetical protein [uncultured Megasphaera sp.]
MKRFKIICPAASASGGPELLHQFCYEARILGFDSEMIYISDDSNLLKMPVAEQYLHYGNPYELQLNDDKNSIFIIPEACPQIVPLIKRGKKIFWWLSVDNYLKQFYFYHGKDYSNSVIAPFLRRAKILLNKATDIRKYNVDYHLVQSYYAWDYCTKIGIHENQIFYLSDYLNDDYITYAKQNLAYPKKNQVLYNPKKGYDFTKRLIEAAPELRWIPIIDMTYNEVVDYMKESKVYIDFGNHPGKDRIPREAAVNGCCVITGKKGSAAFQRDVDIPSEYKFEDSIKSITRIINKIKYIFENYDKAINDFANYRKKIYGEREQFISDLERICIFLTSDNDKDYEGDDK